LRALSLEIARINSSKKEASPPPPFPSERELMMTRKNI